MMLLGIRLFNLAPGRNIQGDSNKMTPVHILGPPGFISLLISLIVSGHGGVSPCEYVPLEGVSPCEYALLEAPAQDVLCQALL